MGHQSAPPGMTAKDGIERERALGLGEEPLGARLTPDAPSQQVGTEITEAERTGHPLAGKQPGSDTLGPVLEQDREDIAGTHHGDGTAPEVANVVGQREGGEVGHRIGHLVGNPWADEDPPLEGVGKLSLDAVRLEGRHLSAGSAFRCRLPGRGVGSRPIRMGRMGRMDINVGRKDIVER